MNVAKGQSRANRVGRSLKEHSRAPYLRGTASRERSGALEHQPVPENALNVPHDCKWASIFQFKVHRRPSQCGMGQHREALLDTACTLPTHPARAMQPSGMQCALPNSNSSALETAPCLFANVQTHSTA